MITTKDLRMVRGQTYPLLFTVKSALGARVDLTNATVHFSVRTDLKAQPIIHKFSPVSGAVVLPQTGDTLGGDTLGQFTVALAGSDTASLVPGDYYYDAWIVDASLARYPVVATSRLAIQQEVSNLAGF
jgi:hypothetical protein